jgi:hypothetical protein
MMDSNDKASLALDGFGLPCVGGFSRSQEFHEGCGALAEAMIVAIEGMMGGSVSDDNRSLLHAAVERIANVTGPQLAVTQE